MQDYREDFGGKLFVAKCSIQLSYGRNSIPVEILIIAESLE